MPFHIYTKIYKLILINLIFGGGNLMTEHKTMATSPIEKDQSNMGKETRDLTTKISIPYKVLSATVRIPSVVIEMIQGARIRYKQYRCGQEGGHGPYQINDFAEVCQECGYHKIFGFD